MGEEPRGCDQEIWCLGYLHRPETTQPGTQKRNVPVASPGRDLTRVGIGKGVLHCRSVRRVLALDT